MELELIKEPLNAVVLFSDNNLSELITRTQEFDEGIKTQRVIKGEIVTAMMANGFMASLAQKLIKLIDAGKLPYIYIDYSEK